jgi:hypothetical protein
MFVSAAFSRYDLGRDALTGGVGLPRLRLGAGSPGLLSQIEAITSSADKAALRKKYDDCQAKSGTAEIVCYAGLAADLYAAGGSPSTPTPTAPMPLPQPAPASSFPIVPVLIATLGAGALIYFLVVKGKK